MDQIVASREMAVQEPGPRGRAGGSGWGDRLRESKRRCVKDAQGMRGFQGGQAWPGLYSHPARGPWELGKGSYD